MTMRNKCIFSLIDTITTLVVRMNDDAQYSDIIEDLDAIKKELSSESRRQVPGGQKYQSDPEKYYYKGLEFVHMNEANRPERCTFSVSKGGSVLASFEMMRDLKTAFDSNGTEHALDMNKSDMRVRGILKEMARRVEAGQEPFKEPRAPKKAAPAATKKEVPEAAPKKDDSETSTAAPKKAAPKKAAPKKAAPKKDVPKAAPAAPADVPSAAPAETTVAAPAAAAKAFNSWSCADRLARYRSLNLK